MLSLIHIFIFLTSIAGLIAGLLLGLEWFGWMGCILGALIGSYIGLVIGRLIRLVLGRLLGDKNTGSKDGTRN